MCIKVQESLQEITGETHVKPLAPQEIAQKCMNSINLTDPNYLPYVVYPDVLSFLHSHVIFSFNRTNIHLVLLALTVLESMSVPLHELENFLCMIWARIIQLDGDLLNHVSELARKGCAENILEKEMRDTFLFHTMFSYNERTRQKEFLGKGMKHECISFLLVIEFYICSRVNT